MSPELSNHRLRGILRTSIRQQPCSSMHGVVVNKCIYIYTAYFKDSAIFKQIKQVHLSMSYITKFPEYYPLQRNDKSPAVKVNALDLMLQQNYKIYVCIQIDSYFLSTLKVTLFIASLTFFFEIIKTLCITFSICKIGCNCMDIENIVNNEWVGSFFNFGSGITFLPIFGDI